jgi:hypothetical protein
MRHSIKDAADFNCYFYNVSVESRQDYWLL